MPISNTPLTNGYLTVCAFTSAPKGYKVNRGLLYSGIMASYIVFLCCSAIRSEPVSEKCGAQMHGNGHSDWTSILVRLCHIPKELCHFLELWYNTILILLTGNMKNAEVAIDALSICLNINGWEMMIALGFLAATSVRVSNELGRGSSKAAKFAIMQIVPD